MKLILKLEYIFQLNTVLVHLWNSYYNPVHTNKQQSMCSRLSDISIFQNSLSSEPVLFLRHWYQVIKPISFKLPDHNFLACQKKPLTHWISRKFMDQLLSYLPKTLLNGLNKVQNYILHMIFHESLYAYRTLFLFISFPH
jgi:hypothetical protein